MTSTAGLAALSTIPDLVSVPEAGLARYAAGLPPLAALQPLTEEAAVAAMQALAAADMPILPWGGGSALAGHRPQRPCVIVDLGRLNRIVEYSPRDRVITVEAGATIADVAAAVAAEGQLLPLDPPQPGQATVGGAIASGLSGPRRYRYGTARDLVIGSRAILADGQVVNSGGRVAKNVAGYDLNKLWIGSAGTLAVLTALTFRLWPAPPVSEIAILQFASLTEAHQAAMEIAGSTMQPLSLDLAGPDVLPARAGVAENAWALIVENGGTAATVARVRAELHQLSKHRGASAPLLLTDTKAAAIMMRLRDFAGPAGDGELLLRAAVLPSQTATACALLQEAPLGRPMIVARAGNGVVHARWSAIDAAAVGPCVARLREALAALGGMLAIEHADAAVMISLDPWGLSGDDLAVMRRLKAVFDPRDRLNPGCSPGGSDRMERPDEP